MDCLLVGEAAGRRQGVQAVEGEFVGRDVLAYGSGLRRVGDKFADELAKVPMGGGDVLAAVQLGGQAGVVRPPVGDRRRVGREYRRQPLHAPSVWSRTCRS